LRRRPSILILVPLLLTGCPTEEFPPPEVETPGAGFSYGDEIVCDNPTAGWDRFSEEGLARGLTEPMTNPSTVFGIDIWGRGGGLVVQDMDNDGDIDIVASQVSGTPHFYANDGDGRFTLVDEIVPGTLGNPLALAAADLDGDNLPELFFASGNAIRLARNLGDFRFATAELIVPPNAMGQTGALSLALGDLDGDLDLDLIIATISGGPDDGETVGAPDLLLRNDGGLSFSVAGSLISEGIGSITQLAIFTDRDLDGDQDIFIPNDQGPPSAFYRNDGGGVLVNDAEAISADLDMAAMGIDNWDLNGDGILDYCMSDVGPPRCLLSDGSGGYYEGGASLGLYPAEPVAAHPSTVGWAFDFADLNGDGLIDAIQASGPCPGAAQAGVLAIPDLMWAGLPGGLFEDVTAESGFGNPLPNYGLAAADFDGDGYLDIVVAGPDYPPYLFMNSCGAGAWLEFDLIGPPENRQGYGSRVFVEVGGVLRQRELGNLRGQAQGPARLHFGLGDVDVVDRVTVVWTDGTVSTSDHVPTRRRVTVDWAEAAGDPFVPPAGDDDDDLVDDGTGPLQPDDGEVVIQGSAFTPGKPPGGADGLGGLTVSSSHDPKTLRATNGSGGYSLLVPEDTEVSISLVGEGVIPSISPIDTSWQTSPQQGLFHAIYDTNSLGDFYQNLFGYPVEPETSMVWIQVGAGPGEMLVGSIIDLSSEHAAPWAIGDGAPEQTNVMIDGVAFVAFGNVVPGPLEITLTTPQDEECLGRTSFDVIADSVMLVSFRCQ
jgi:hypothetical protein